MHDRFNPLCGHINTILDVKGSEQERCATDLAMPRNAPWIKGYAPRLFGRGVRDRVLMTLAVNRRPLYVAELVQLLRTNGRKVRKSLTVLETCGLVVRAHASTPGLGRFVRLNRGFPAARELLTLLRALERRCPQPRAARPGRVAERVALRRARTLRNPVPFSTVNLDRIFYSKVRTRSLLAIAASHSTDVSHIAITFVERRNSVWNAVEHWEREGIVRSVVIGRRRALELDPGYYAAKELRLFLKALRRIAGEYDRRARLGLRDPHSPRFRRARKISTTRTAR